MKRIGLVLLALLLLGCSALETGNVINMPDLSSAEPTAEPLVVVQPPRSAVTATPAQTPPFRVEPTEAPPTPTSVPTRNSNSNNITVVPIATDAPQIETTRVVFAAGASSARLAGNLPARSQVSYTLGALEGQEMQLGLRSSSGQAKLMLQTGAGFVLFDGVGNSAEWRGTLPATDDYIVSAVASDTATTYEIEVLILPLGDVGASDTLTITRQHTPLGNLEFVFEGVAGNNARFNVNEMRATVQGSIVLLESGLDTSTYLQDPELGLRIVDVNFDGYDDVLLQLFLPAGPNIPYNYYIYHPALGQFVLDEAYYNISAPVIDPAARTITAYERMGAAGGTITTYRIVNNKPVAVRVETALYTAAGQTVYTVEDAEQGDILLVSSDGRLSPSNLLAQCPAASAERSLVINATDGYCLSHPASAEATSFSTLDSVMLAGPTRGGAGNMRFASISISRLGSANGQPLEQIVEVEVDARTPDESVQLGYEELTIGGQFAVGVTGLSNSAETEQLIFTIANDTIYLITRSPLNDATIEQDMQQLWQTLADSLIFLPVDS